jgi:hypothetical protein
VQEHDGGGRHGKDRDGQGPQVELVLADLGLRHQRARVAWVCQYPETAWCRLAALAPCSETLFARSTAGSLVNSHTCLA